MCERHIVRIKVNVQVYALQIGIRKPLIVRDSSTCATMYMYSMHWRHHHYKDL